MVLAAVSALAQRGCAVVLASHDLNLVAGLADSIAVLQQGRVAALGAPREIFTPQLFREIFAIDVLVQPHPERDQPLVISR
jgi:iron complex transport system ATP-binding protein